MKTSLLLAWVLVTLIACGNKQVNTTVSTTSSQMEATGDTSKVFSLLGAEAFNEQMKKESGTLIDVRTPGEHKKGYIDGAVLMDIFNDNFDTELAKLDKTKTYYVYCAKGGRSEECTEKMKALGFKKVYDLDGGFSDWLKAGLPVVVPKQ